jgi:hypothetical protein
MKRQGTFPVLAAGTAAVAALATLAVPGGWLLWVPVGLALAVTGKVWHVRGR